MDRFGTVAIVGVGLIGGSIGMALRDRGLADRVVGIGRNPEALERARSRGVIDLYETEIRAGVVDAEVMVICTPVGRVADDATQAARYAPDGALITDAGSTKRGIVERVEADPRARSLFVGAHPIAGSERKGADFSSATLFQDRMCILTPTESTAPDRLEKARRFWSAIGCRVESRSLEDHDRILSYTSHLPHVVASALAATISPQCLPFAAGAYRDGTRVAASDGALWAAIFKENRGHVLDALDDFESRLRSFRETLRGGDEAAVERWWAEGWANRAEYQEPGTLKTDSNSHD